MKKRFLYITAILMLLAAPFLWAGVTNFDSVTVQPESSDTYGLRVNNSSGTRIWSIAKTNGPVKSLPIPIMGFSVIGATSTNVSPITVFTGGSVATGANALRLYQENTYYPGIRWYCCIVTPVYVTFRAPDNYRTGGTFKVLCYQSALNTAISADMLVNTPSSTSSWSSTFGSQSVVTVSTANVVSPFAVTLAPGGTIAAGDWVTLRLWRSSNSSTGTLSVLGVEFYYNAYD